MKTKKTGLLLICLSLLSACSTKPAKPSNTVVVTKLHYVLPPENLISACDLDVMRGNSNLDLLQHALRQTNNIRLCNAQIARYQGWLLDAKRRVEKNER